MTRDLSIEELIERSSLGSPHAAVVRRRASPTIVRNVLARTAAVDAHRLPPRLLPGQFTIRPVADLGAGGLGAVDEVVVTASRESHPVGARLARKRLNARWMNDPGAQARFDREIEILGTLTHHHIVSLQGVGIPGQPSWYVMPLFRRGSLRNALVAGRRFERLSDLAIFAAKIAEALAYAHSLGFVHRDLKPENILLDGDDEPVLADWGLGQFIHRHSKVLDLTRGGPMGSQYYCSLEQWCTGRCDPTGDIYSLGVVLAELAFGSPLPITPVGSGMHVDVLTPTSWARREFNTVIRAMTAVHPAARVQTMHDVSQVMLEIARAE